MADDRFAIQAGEYQFPYHHIPHWNSWGPSRIRPLSWGMHYLASQRDMKETVEDWKPSSVLEIGCGDGAMIGVLDKRIHRVGVDLEPRSIGFAQAFHPDVEFYAQDAGDIKQEFDAVTVIEVLEHIPDHAVDAFLQSVFARVRPGGMIYLTVPHKNMPVLDKHYRHYDDALLREQLRLAGVPAKTIKIRPFYSGHILESFYKKLTNNRLFVGESPLLSNLIWNLCWKSAKNPDPNKAHQLIAEIQKA